MIWNRTAFIQQIPSLRGKASDNKVSAFLELTFSWGSQATIPVNSSPVMSGERKVAVGQRGEEETPLDRVDREAESKDEQEPALRRDG